MIEDVCGHVLFGAEDVGTNSHGNIIVRHLIYRLIRNELFKEFEAEFECSSSQWIKSSYEFLDRGQTVTFLHISQFTPLLIMFKGYQWCLHFSEKTLPVISDEVTIFDL